VSGALEEQQREIDLLKVAIKTLSDSKDKETAPKEKDSASSPPTGGANFDILLADRDARIRELEDRVSDYRVQIDALSRRGADGLAGAAAAHLSDLQVRISSLIAENAALQMQVKELSSSPMLLQFDVSYTRQELLSPFVSIR
jgi:uncharacterized coiled-coil protein SlyX